MTEPSITRRQLLGRSGAALAGGATALAGCAALNPNPTQSRSEADPQGSVSSYKYDPARTGVATSALPGAGATTQWSTDPEVQNAIFISWAAVDRQRVYADLLTFGQFPSPVVALDRETGTVEWRHETDGSIPALADDTLYIADDRVRALETPDGNRRWVGPAAADGTFGAPAVVDGTVYATTGETVYALDSATGATRWTVDRGRRFGSPVAVADGTVYAVHAAGPDADDDELIALDAADGTVRWQRPLPEGTDAAPAIADEVVLVADYQGTVYAVERGDGTVRWQRTLDDQPSSPAVANGRAYVRTRRGTIAALAVADGAVDWHRSANQVRDSFRYPITVTDDALVTSGGKALVVRDLETGAQQYELSVDDDRVLGGVTVVDETIYAGGTTAGEFAIYALGK